MLRSFSVRARHDVDRVYERYETAYHRQRVRGSVNGTGRDRHNATGSLECIDGTDLVYDKDTRIVYYKFKDFAGYKGYGFMSPYYGLHGNLCRYENGQVVEMNGVSNVSTYVAGSSPEKAQADNR